MKNLRLAFAVAAAAASTASAQGTLSLNTATGTKPRITIGGVSPTYADNLWIQVLVAGATSLTGTQTFQLPSFPGGNPIFSKGTLTVNGIPGGAAVDVVIRAWDKDFGRTYDETPDGYRGTQTLKNFVLGGIVDANGIAGLPNSIVPAFTGFNIAGTPEPHTWVLAAMGFGAIARLRSNYCNPAISNAEIKHLE